MSLLIRKKRSLLLTGMFLSLLILNGYTAVVSDSVLLYTAYRKISVTPGTSIDYPIDLINNSKEVINVDMSLSGLPASWTYSMKVGAYDIRQLSVLPGEKKSISLKVDVPMKVNKGNYRFQLSAGEIATLPMVINISEQGNYTTEFTTDQANMEGNATSTFTYTASLRNRTPEKMQYAFMADPPAGWSVIFRHSYKQVTSAEINANSKADIQIEIDPPDMAEAGKYRVPVRAVSSASTEQLVLEVVITGTFGIELTTPSGLLSTSLIAGKKKNVEMVVKNTGSSELKNIELSAAHPVNWTVTFDPKKIDKLEAGKNATVIATIEASKKAIAGDYVTTMEARAPEVNSKAVFRITVKTSMVWGWVGILIIALALGSVYYLFRKYGRR